RPPRRLPRVRRVRNGQGRRRAGLDRRGCRHARAPPRHQASRRRPHPHLRRPPDRRGARPMTTNDEPCAHAQARIPGAGKSPIRAFRAVGGTPYFVERAEGPRVWDVEGTEYLDLVQSYGAVIAGHAHPAIVSAIQGAATKGTSYGAPTEGEVRIAEEICARVPSVEKVRLVSSGTEATMSAIRLARGHTGRT